MKITAKLAAKVGVLVGLSGVGITGVYLGGDYANNLLSKYEKALIAFLNSNGGNDIVFEVKKKDDTMISYAGDTENSISAKVQIANGSSSAFRRIDEKTKDADKLMENIRHAGEN